MKATIIRVIPPRWDDLTEEEAADAQPTAVVVELDREFQSMEDVQRYYLDTYAHDDVQGTEVRCYTDSLGMRWGVGFTPHLIERKRGRGGRRA